MPAQPPPTMATFFLGTGLGGVIGADKMGVGGDGCGLDCDFDLCT